MAFSLIGLWLWRMLGKASELCSLQPFARPSKGYKRAARYRLLLISGFLGSSPKSSTTFLLDP
jgi:hypothetical protein